MRFQQAAIYGCGGEWLSSEDVYLSKIRQEVMRTREEHKDMYLPEVIDMLLKRKPPKKCEK